MHVNVVSAENPHEPHILLVDDNPVTLEKMASSFESRGYLVTCSTTGFEAGILLKEYPDAFDAVLVDHSITCTYGIKSTFPACSRSGHAPFVMPIDIDYFLNGNRLCQAGLEDKTRIAMSRH